MHAEIGIALQDYYIYYFLKKLKFEFEWHKFKYIYINVIVLFAKIKGVEKRREEKRREEKRREDLSFEMKLITHDK